MQILQKIVCRIAENALDLYVLLPTVEEDRSAFRILISERPETSKIGFSNNAAIFNFESVKALTAVLVPAMPPIP